MIIEKKKKDGIMIYTVKKNFSDEKAAKLLGTEVKPSMIEAIIDEDADVYTDENKLLLRFRKNLLNPKHVQDFYDNVIKFAMNTTSNRRITAGKKKGEAPPKIMANILGYMDGFSPSQKVAMRQKDLLTQLAVRESRFNMDFPDEYQKALPMIKQIDSLYKKHLPGFYRKQRAKADETFYRVENTSFTTITTNVNFKTRIHKDAGDDAEGYGNLVVMEHGKYSGAETCFPQFGVGVNVRMHDMLFMDVHEWHANLPLKLATPDSKRLSVVCYLRIKVWERTKGLTKERVRKHDEKLRKLGDHPARPKTPKGTLKRKPSKQVSNGKTQKKSTNNKASKKVNKRKTQKKKGFFF